MSDFPALTQIPGFKQLQSEPPSVVYHYTSAKGLIGMLDSGALWATHGSYLNDQSELKYNLDQIDMAIKRAEETYAKSHTAHYAFLKSAVERQRSLLPKEPVFVASFTERRDHLSQWERYAGRHGFAIGFNSSKILSLRDSNNFILTKIIYTKAKQIAALEAVLEAIFERAETDVAIDEQSFDGENLKEHKVIEILQWADSHAGRLWLASLCFKDRSFEEEREWRLLTILENEEISKLGFRTGQFGLVPYCTIPIREDTSHWAIGEIILGTTHYRDESEYALELAMHKYGIELDQVKISHSTIPLRV